MFTHVLQVYVCIFFLFYKSNLLNIVEQCILWNLEVMNPTYIDINYQWKIKKPSCGCEFCPIRRSHSKHSHNYISYVSYETLLWHSKQTNQDSLYWSLLFQIKHSCLLLSLLKVFCNHITRFTNVTLPSVTLGSMVPRKCINKQIDATRFQWTYMLI
jgi:hypothetical protein